MKHCLDRGERRGDTDFPLYDAHGRVQRIGGIAEDVAEAKLAAVLPAELQHRVRNIMAQILPFTARTGERAESAPSRPPSRPGA